MTKPTARTWNTGSVRWVSLVLTACAMSGSGRVDIQNIKGYWRIWKGSMDWLLLFTLFHHVSDILPRICLMHPLLPCFKGEQVLPQSRTPFFLIYAEDIEDIPWCKHISRKTVQIYLAQQFSTTTFTTWGLNPYEQWPKPWLFAVYIGDYTTQLYRDFNKPL